MWGCVTAPRDGVNRDYPKGYRRTGGIIPTHATTSTLLIIGTFPGLQPTPPDGDIS